MRRRGNPLETLLHLKLHEIHEIGREMAELNAALADHEADKRRIAEMLQERPEIDHPEASRFTADFLRNAAELLRRQERRIEALDIQAREARRRLEDIFLEKKQVEILLDRQRDQKQKAMLKHETRAIDEHAIQTSYRISNHHPRLLLT